MSDFFRFIVHDFTAAVVGVVMSIGLLPTPSSPAPASLVANDPVAKVATTTPTVSSTKTNPGQRTPPKQDSVAKPLLGTTSPSHSLLDVPASKTKPLSSTSSPAVVEKAPEEISEKAIDSSTLASMSNATFEEILVHTIPKPTLSGLGNRLSQDKKAYITLLIFDSTKKQVFEKKYNELVNNNWYSIVTTPLKAGNYTAELYDAKDHTFLARQLFVVDLTTDSDGPLGDTSGTGLLETHIGQSFGKTASISYDSALSNCQLNGKNNPTRQVKCYWKGKEIFKQLGNAATIDETTLTTSSQHPTFTGTASGLSTVGLRIYSKNPKCGGCPYYGDNEKPLWVPVTNGRWTFAAAEKALPPGRYGLSLMYKDKEIWMALFSGTIVITG